MKADVTFTLRLPSQLKHELAMEAASQNETSATVVIEALKSYLSRRAKAKAAKLNPPLEGQKP